MSDAISSQGIKLQIGDGAGPEVFSTIAEITNLNGPNESSERIDVTSFDSLDGYREFIQGLKDGGEVAIEFNFVGSNAQQQQLDTDFKAGTKRNFKLLLPDAALDADKTTYSFVAIVQNLGLTGGVNAAVKGSCTLKLTGGVTKNFAS